MAFFTEHYKLPSGGIVYDRKFSDVTVRNITTAEEKLLLGSSNKAIDDLISACIVEPKDLDLSKLIIPDKHFILVKIRVVSYGSEYEVDYRCPSCSKMGKYKINLDDLNVYYLEDGFTQPFDVELPVSKDTLSISIPTGADLDNAEKQGKKLHKKFPEAKGDYAYICRIMANIKEVNSEELTFEKLREYVEAMHGKDSAFLRKSLEDIKVGIDTEIEDTCPLCGDDIKFMLPFGENFFRPQF